ncbi:class I SAM-dependent methyltransferase [Chloroflexota bacterium]
MAFLDSIRKNKAIPLKNVGDVFRDTTTGPWSITLWPADLGGWMGSYAGRTVDLISLCMLCKHMNPMVVFEIGTFHGHSALHLALNAPDDAVVFTLDLPPEDSSTANLSTTSMDRLIMEYRSEDCVFTGTSVEPKIRRLFGNSALFDFSQYYGTVDLFFIDGAHSYECARSDTLNALRCCHSESVIAWHDYGRRGVNGVSPWLAELSQHLPIYAVPGGSLAFSLVEEPLQALKTIGVRIS